MTNETELALLKKHAEILDELANKLYADELISTCQHHELGWKANVAATMFFCYMHTMADVAKIDLDAEIEAIVQSARALDDKIRNAPTKHQQRYRPSDN